MLHICATFRRHLSVHCSSSGHGSP